MSISVVVSTASCGSLKVTAWGCGEIAKESPFVPSCCELNDGHEHGIITCTVACSIHSLQSTHQHPHIHIHTDINRPIRLSEVGGKKKPVWGKLARPSRAAGSQGIRSSIRVKPVLHNDKQAFNENSLYWTSSQFNSPSYLFCHVVMLPYTVLTIYLLWFHEIIVQGMVA